MDLLDFVDSTTHLSFLHFTYSRLRSAIAIAMIGFCLWSDHGPDPSLRKSGIFCFIIYYYNIFYKLNNKIAQNPDYSNKI